MKLRLMFFLLTLILPALPVCAKQYKIVIPAGAIPAEVTAAEELRDSLRKISGAELEIVRDETVSPAIFVGNSARAAALTGVDFSTLKPDEIILKRVGDDLVLAGQRPRGSLYAVYEFLECFYGVRFWTADASLYPKQPAFALPENILPNTPNGTLKSTANGTGRAIGPSFV